MINETLIENTLKEIFDGIEFAEKPEGLYDPLRYMISIGGKRIRPRLCLTVFSIYQDNFCNGIQEAASALEVFHSFTLIHDDIMDNAPIRRGRETVWKKWNANTAILSGDVMSIDSYRRISKVSPQVLPSVLSLFTQTAAQVCEGQQMDMDFENEPRIKMEDYMKMIGLKTAVLIACAAKMGALIALAPETDCENLYNFGYDLGMAFQIADDYLDTFGDKKTFGKAIGGDIINSKKTWLLTRAMEKDENAISRAMSMPVGTAEKDAAKIEAVSHIYRSLDIDKDARAEIIRFHELAMKHVDNISLSKVKARMLLRYAEKLVGREK